MRQFFKKCSPPHPSTASIKELEGNLAAYEIMFYISCFKNDVKIDITMQIHKYIPYIW